MQREGKGRTERCSYFHVVPLPDDLLLVSMGRGTVTGHQPPGPAVGEYNLRKGAFD